MNFQLFSFGQLPAALRRAATPAAEHPSHSGPPGLAELGRVTSLTGHLTLVTCLGHHPLKLECPACKKCRLRPAGGPVGSDESQGLSRSHVFQPQTCSKCPAREWTRRPAGRVAQTSSCQ